MHLFYFDSDTNSLLDFSFSMESLFLKWGSLVVANSFQFYVGGIA
jgi:hypothetical protein